MLRRKTASPYFCILASYSLGVIAGRVVVGAETGSRRWVL